MGVLAKHFPRGCVTAVSEPVTQSAVLKKKKKKDYFSYLRSLHLSGHQAGCGDAVLDSAVETCCSHCPHE